MVRPALAFWGPHRRQASCSAALSAGTRRTTKRFKNTVAVALKRWWEVGGHIWEDFLKEVHFQEEAKFPGTAELDRCRWRGMGKNRARSAHSHAGKRGASCGAGAN